ncbi:MAG: leucine-rich repeat domain-containing protein, partial [Muribaculaceae bacterium]|nr:leucine-rich repeat domain-containing protein [Muribaculaceae bacterium]
MKDIIVPQSVLYIENMAFALTKLNEIAISKSIKNIARDAFSIIKTKV